MKEKDSMNWYKKMIISGFVISVISLSANSELYDAISRGDLPRVQALVAAGADLMHRDANYETVVDYARKKGAPAIIFFLEVAQLEQLIATETNLAQKKRYEDRLRQIRNEAMSAEKELR
jgi:hypothetical protein